jgi:hypothetical protein
MIYAQSSVLRRKLVSVEPNMNVYVTNEKLVRAISRVLSLDVCSNA